MCGPMQIEELLMKTRRFVLVAGALASLAAFGCQTTAKETAKPASMGAMNSKCPFSGKDVNAATAEDYKGQKVAFCCNGCKGKFDAMSDKEKAAKIAGMTAK
jgi:outer membrane murein-binding lipoprotein Lpp